MADPRADLRALAAHQDGQFAVRQAAKLGLTYSAVRNLHGTGEAVALRRGVLRFSATPGAPDPAVTAWLLCWPHGVISHRSAAVHHGLRRVSQPPLPEITVPHGARRRPSGVLVHVSRELPGADVLRVGEVTYRSLARTVCDLADHRDPRETLAVLDDAIALGARRRWIHQRAETLSNGRNGVALIHSATATGAAAEFRSWLERTSSVVYRRAGLPDPEWNVPVYDTRGLIGVVDALWRPWRVISEKEGLRFHATPQQRKRDAERWNRLDEADYTIRRFTWQDVVDDPVAVAATLGRALVRAGAPVDLSRIPRRIDVPGLPWG